MGNHITPKEPVYAHHRILRELTHISHEDDKVAPTPEEFNRISRVFRRRGGSWIRLYQGSIEDMTLLKLTLKVAIEKGFVTKASSWGGK